MEQIQDWVQNERKRQVSDKHGRAQTDTESANVSVGDGPCQSLSSSVLAANAVLSLLNLTCHLLNNQINTQAEAFEKEGGFTERLYRVRSRARNRKD